MQGGRRETRETSEVELPGLEGKEYSSQLCDLVDGGAIYEGRNAQGRVSGGRISHTC